MSFTTPRILKNAVVAFAFQTAYGTAAGTTTVLRLQADESDLDPGFEYIEPRGTTGSHWPKDTITKAATRPKARFKLLASPKLAAFFLGLALGGGNAASTAASDITEANDGGTALSTWVLAGVRPGFNTDSAWKIYVTLTDETPGAGEARVSLYSDAARTALVAQGSAANNNTVTLAEQNNSGLSGTVALAAPSATDSDIELTLVSVRPQVSASTGAYITCWRDHGSGAGLERAIDCVVAKLTRSSEETGSVTYDVDLVGSTYLFDSGTGGTFTAGLATADKEYYLHGTAAWKSDVDSGNVTEHALRTTLEIENDIDVVLANSITPTAIYKRGVKMCRVQITQRLTSEAQAIVMRGLAMTFESIRLTDTYGARDCDILADRALVREPKFPNTTGEGWGDVENTFEIVEETATSPTAPLTIVVDL